MAVAKEKDMLSDTSTNQAKSRHFAAQQQQSTQTFLKMIATGKHFRENSGEKHIRDAANG